MKFLYFLKEKIFNQTVLYIWFMIIMILPCFVLAMTEPLSIWVRTASVFIPAAFFGLAFNLFRKPGYFIIISVILLLINGYQLVLIYLFSESVVSPDMFLNIVTSSSGESGELMRTIWPAVTIACVLYFSALLMGIFSIINKQKLSYYFIKRSCITAGVFAVIGVLCLLVNKSKNYPFEADHNIYPYNALYNLNFAVKKYYRILNYPKTSDGFTYNAVKTKESSKREVIVLVIGETSRAHNWQLYGYQRNTTPKLSQRDDIIVYKDVLTQANTTHKIVPIILSPASAENFDMIYKSKSLITAYKEAGYKTAFVSNQIPDKALIDAFASEADTLIQLKNIDSDNIHPYDNEIGRAHV